MLSHADDTFRQICRPQIEVSDENVMVSENKLMVKWKASTLESWLESSEQEDIKVITLIFDYL